MDKELLFKPRLPEADVDVPGVGTVRVRGLSRAEAMHVQDVKGTEARERRLVSLGMVDPELTEAEVGKWQKASKASELEPVTEKITELSGLLESSAKEAVKAFVADPDAEFRALPSPEAGDDGGPATDGDVER